MLIETIRTLLLRYLDLDISAAFLSRVGSTLVILLLLWALQAGSLRLINRQFYNQPKLLYNWRKAAKYGFVVVGVFLIGRTWLEGIQSLATYLGIVTAGLAVALQDLIIDVAGWAFIISRRPFSVGDRIEIDGQSGDVVDIRVFQFSMLEIGNRLDAEQSTGRVIHVPNGKIFTQSQINWSQGIPFIWNEIPVLITFESDWEKAKHILEYIVKEKAPDVSRAVKEYSRRPDRRYVISYRNTSPVVYTEVAGSGVRLTLRYLIAPRQRRNSEQTMWEAILRAFGQHWDIDFAYETSREYVHFQEGKRPSGHGPTHRGYPIPGQSTLSE